MNEEFPTGSQPDRRDLIEAKDNAEALKADFVHLCHSLQSLVTELQRQGLEGAKLAKALFLEQTLSDLQRPENERGFDADFSAVRRNTDITAPNFVSRWLYGYSGAINNLGKAYLRVKTFYKESPDFSDFITNFENFIVSVNKNNTKCKIPALPELLLPMDEETFQLSQDSVEQAYTSVPKIRQVVGAKLSEHSKSGLRGSYLIIDLATMPMDETGFRPQKAKVKIASPAQWEN
jgi:hypothetical protein